MMAIQSCFCLWPFWMLNYREAWGCISCAISSSFFLCRKCVAILKWSRGSTLNLPSDYKSPIQIPYILPLPAQHKDSKDSTEGAKKQLLFHLCVRCSWNAYPNVSVFVKRIYALFFFSCTFRTYLRPLLLFVLEADRLPPDTWAMISPWDCHSGAFSVYMYMCTCVSLSPSIWMRTRRVYGVLFDLFVVLGLFALFSFHAGWIWAFRVIEKAFQMQLRKFHCVFPFDNNNNGSIRICARGSFQSTVEPEAPGARSCPSAEIRMFFFSGGFVKGKLGLLLCRN